MHVPMLDLKPQYEQIKDEIQREIADLCASQMFILGPKVEAFEQQAAAYCGARFACAVSSGSDALLLALMVEGIGPGDEVITSPYTFFATAGAISRTGATPVFADIDPAFYTLNPDLVEAMVTPKTKAIIPVHLYGQPADLDPILAIARRHHLVVIEDAAQAIGAEYKQRRVGAIGDYGCLSFFPSKNLGGFGDAGMVLCNCPERAEKLNIFRNHGMMPKYHHRFIGGNFRMDALQAAVLTIKLKYLDGWTARRQQNADDYNALLAHVPELALPAVAPWTTRHVRNQYVIRVQAPASRQAVWDGLKNAGIGCDVYYPIPLHRQPCYAGLGYRPGDFPESERAAAETIAIPIYPELAAEPKKLVAQTLRNLVKGSHS